ncbi:MAG: hypothetical protein K6C32_02465 [Bacilli bacterium]|nr:hypothetical protein [Bacilli bacterium]
MEYNLGRIEKDGRKRTVEYKQETIINPPVEQTEAKEGINENPPKETPKNVTIPKVETPKKQTPIEKGQKFRIVKDFTDYGLQFKKGMVGTLESEPDKEGLVSVHMTDKIKGFFKLPLDCIEII